MACVLDGAPGLCRVVLYKDKKTKIFGYIRNCKWVEVHNTGIRETRVQKTFFLDSWIPID